MMIQNCRKRREIKIYIYKKYISTVYIISVYFADYMVLSNSLRNFCNFVTCNFHKLII